MSTIDDFCEALQSGGNEKILGMIRSDPWLADARNADGISLMLLAAYHRNQEALTRMVDRKQEWDLFEAAASGQIIELGKILEDRDMEVNGYSPDGFTAAGLAAFFGQEEALSMLYSYGADLNRPSRNRLGVSPVHSATAGGHIEIVSFLVSQDADVNVRQAGGITALHSAAHRGDLDMARILVEAGADIHALTDNRKSPVDMALEAGHEHLANYLQRMENKKKKRDDK